MEDRQRVKTGEVRLSYVNLFEARVSEKFGGAPSYSVTLLIPKSDTATHSRIMAGIEAAKEAAMEKGIWGKKLPAYVHLPIHDGDGEKEDHTPYGDECKGCWVMRAKRSDKMPEVVDRACQPIMDQSEVYSGVYGIATLRFYGYNKGKNGIGCGLGNVMITRPGEPLASSGKSAEEDFGGDDDLLG